MKFRPVAVPLVTVDPFFSIWSCSDHLYNDCTKHWSGRPNPIIAGVFVNEKYYYMNAVNVDFVQCPTRLYQKNLSVTPLSTVYTFENDFVKVKLTFTTPLLLEHLDILSRPVSYVEYNIEKKCDDSAKIRFVFGINARCCVDNKEQQVEFKKTDFSLCCGNVNQNPLAQSGDNVMIDWGYLHLCDKDSSLMQLSPDFRLVSLPINKTYNAYSDMPYMVVFKEQLSGVITLAYDEINPIEYFGSPLKEYYTKYYDSFEDMVKNSIKEYYKIKKMCEEFDLRLLKEAEQYGENYKNIASLSYRQAVSAHKLVCDDERNIIFLSKECDSNGCIGTLDVTYPSIPLFLKYNPELVLAMLRPIIKYAKSVEWAFDFTPHDVGIYPLANGQVYGMDDPNHQMPIEETANMFLCLAAVSKYSGNKKIFKNEEKLMKQWVQYLINCGYDPGEQLCTDDFAGHLNHNCNLSIKAILGIASYGYLSGEEYYLDLAKKMASEWEKDAKAPHGATKLAFDNPNSWSLKYNMVWDNLFEFNLFSNDIKKKEIELYKSKFNRYGVPLDSRKDYTKVDWLMWSTCIYDDKDYFDKVSESIVNMINETTDRVPFTDWYYTSYASHIRFKARSVLGGIFIKLI